VQNYIANPGGNPLTPAYGPFSGGAATGTPSFGADVGEVPGVTTTSGDLPTVAQTAATQTEAVSPSVVESVSSAATPAASSGVGSLPIDYAGEAGASPATVTQSINPATVCLHLRHLRPLWKVRRNMFLKYQASSARGLKVFLRKL
jgi:hypothetical protein